MLLVIIILTAVYMYNKPSPPSQPNLISIGRYGNVPMFGEELNEVKDDELLKDLDKIKSDSNKCAIQSGKLNKALDELRTQLNQKKNQYNADFKFCTQKVPEQISKYIRFNKSLGKNITEDEVRRNLNL